MPSMNASMSRAPPVPARGRGGHRIPEQDLVVVQHAQGCLEHPGGGARCGNELGAPAPCGLPLEPFGIALPFAAVEDPYAVSRGAGTKEPHARGRNRQERQLPLGLLPGEAVSLDRGQIIRGQTIGTHGLLLGGFIQIEIAACHAAAVRRRIAIGIEFRPSSARPESPDVSISIAVPGSIWIRFSPG